MRVLKGTFLELHELQERHFPALFSWRNADDFMRLCSTRRNPVSPEEFREEMRRDINKDRHEQFMIVRDKECIGTIYSYNLNRTDGHVFVTTFVAGPWRNRGYGARSMVVFLEYLFREFGLYKVYADVYSYNSESLNALASGGFAEEGRFRGHRLYHDERYDLIRLAFFRSQLRVFARLVRRLTGRHSSA